METSQTMDSNVTSNDVVSSQNTSEEQAKAEKAQLKGLLTEARNTRDMLVDFRSALEDGTFHGARMMAIARGMAFLEAILRQNSAHIKNLQDKLDA